MIVENTKPVVDVPNEVVATQSPLPETLPPANSPEMNAAQFIMTKLPVFRNMVSELTGVQAKRVLNRLIESPLEEKTEKFTTEEAAKTFMLGMHIQNAKHILFLASIKSPDAEQVVDTALKEEEKKQTEEQGVQNGS